MLCQHEERLGQTNLSKLRRMVYPNDGYNPNLGHLCLSQQGVPHRARFKLNVLQSDSSSRLLSDA